MFNETATHLLHMDWISSVARAILLIYRPIRQPRSLQLSLRGLAR